MKFNFTITCPKCDSANTEIDGAYIICHSCNASIDAELHLEETIIKKTERAKTSKLESIRKRRKAFRNDQN